MAMIPPAWELPSGVSCLYLIRYMMEMPQATANAA